MFCKCFILHVTTVLRYRLWPYTLLPLKLNLLLNVGCSGRPRPVILIIGIRVLQSRHLTPLGSALTAVTKCFQCEEDMHSGYGTTSGWNNKMDLAKQPAVQGRKRRTE